MPPEIYSSISLRVPSVISQEAPFKMLLRVPSEVPSVILSEYLLRFLLGLQGIPVGISPGISEVL